MLICHLDDGMFLLFLFFCVYRAFLWKRSKFLKLFQTKQQTGICREWNESKKKGTKSAIKAPFFLLYLPLLISSPSRSIKRKFANRKVTEKKQSKKNDKRRTNKCVTTEIFARISRDKERVADLFYDNKRRRRSWQSEKKKEKEFVNPLSHPYLQYFKKKHPFLLYTWLDVINL